MSDEHNAGQVGDPHVTVLEAEHLSLSFGPINALRDVSLRLEAGRVYGLVGPNGAGKSTLVKILSGFLKPDSGRLTMLGEAVDFEHSRLMNDRGLTLVPQETALVPDLTVSENINLGGELRSGPFLNRSAMLDRSREVLARLGVTIPLNVPAGELPISERRLVMVAKALRADLKILILDEPTAALSAAEASAVLDAVERLRLFGVTTLLITHRFDEIRRVCDAVIAVRDGQIVSEWGNERPSIEELVKVVTGEMDRPLTERDDVVTTAPIALHATDLTGAYLRPMDFTLRRGEIVGVIGRPGSGAQEFLRVLAGVSTRHAARVEIDGVAHVLRSPTHALRAKIGYLPADRAEAGLPEISVRENVMLSSLRQVSGRSFFINAKRERDLTLASVPTRLRSRTSEPFRNLSGGNRQLVLVSRLVAAGTRIFVLSNPTVGVDVRGRDDLRAKVHELAQGGSSVVIYSSEPGELVGLAHRVLIFNDGAVRQTIEGDDISEANLLSAALMAASGIPDEVPER